MLKEAVVDDGQGRDHGSSYMRFLSSRCSQHYFYLVADRSYFAMPCFSAKATVLLGKTKLGAADARLTGHRRPRTANTAVPVSALGETTGKMVDAWYKEQSQSSSIGSKSNSSRFEVGPSLGLCMKTQSRHTTLDAERWEMTSLLLNTVAHYLTFALQRHIALWARWKRNRLRGSEAAWRR